ncbi:MAG: SDR family oxidoreductase [Dehalococcoidia bacterium]|nr:SDR family oxidoreductase [Dehalococcoidia bacterium]MCB9485085.1 SDR family oxidoreductase [Thermoflexaceae bacterium]
MEDQFSLDGKTAIVTGGSRGIGYAIAAAFIQKGARVIITARGETALLEAASSLGGTCIGKRCDNADPADIARVVEEAWRLSPVDILVNNAGISPFYKRAEQVTPAEFDEVVSVNLRGTYFCSVEVANRSFAEQRPLSIVNIGSVGGTTPLERVAVYGATKAGINLLTKSMALEWADRNVRVNCIAPGWTETEFTDELFASRWGDKLRGDIPMGRFATGQDISGAAVFLASDAAQYVTGAILPVDGGRLLR